MSTLMRWRFEQNDLSGCSKEEEDELTNLIMANIVDSTEDDISPCWLWQGAISEKGYGRVKVLLVDGYVWVSSHRLAYMITYGTIPKGFVVEHTCGEPSCCNPRHLFLKRR